MEPGLLYSSSEDAVQNRFKFADRRARRRFTMGREIRYRVMDGQQGVATGTGNTIDISSRGVSFAAGRRLNAGAFVELSISWPVELDHNLPLRLIVYGRIMRSDEGKAVSTIERYEFRTQPRTAVAVAARGDTMLRRWVDENTRLESRA